MDEAKARVSGAREARAPEKTTEPRGAKARGPSEGRERLALLESAIERRLSAIRESFFDVGEALVQIRDGALWKVAKPRSKSFDDYLRRKAWFTRSFANEQIDVAGTYQRASAQALGAARAVELIKYAAVKDRDPAAADRIARGGVIEGKRLHDLEVEDLRELRRAAGKKRKVGSAEREARRRARQLDEWLADRGFPGAVARAVEREDGWIVRTNVDVRVLARFFDAAR